MEISTSITTNNISVASTVCGGASCPLFGWVVSRWLFDPSLGGALQDDHHSWYDVGAPSDRNRHEDFPDLPPWGLYQRPGDIAFDDLMIDYICAFLIVILNYIPLAFKTKKTFLDLILFKPLGKARLVPVKTLNHGLWNPRVLELFGTWHNHIVFLSENGFQHFVTNLTLTVKFWTRHHMSWYFVEEHLWKIWSTTRKNTSQIYIVFTAIFVMCFIMFYRI